MTERSGAHKDKSLDGGFGPLTHTRTHTMKKLISYYTLANTTGYTAGELDAFNIELGGMIADQIEQRGAVRAEVIQAIIAAHNAKVA